MALREHPKKPNPASISEEKITPLVDEGFEEGVRDDAPGADTAFEIDPDQELASIRAEIDRIRESVGLITEASGHYVKRRIQEHSTDVIAENPVRAALWAAFIGFCVGRLSR